MAWLQAHQRSLEVTNSNTLTDHTPVMNTQPNIQPNNRLSFNEKPTLIKRTPRIPRHRREEETGQISPFVPSVAALRQKSQELILQAAHAAIAQNATLFEQLTAEALALNTAATWLASQAYPPGVQAGHPLHIHTK